MLKQTHDNKFNAKWFIRHLKENTYLYFSQNVQNEAVGDRADAL